MMGNRRIEWVAWCLAVGVWTLLLLRPEPTTIQNNFVPTPWRYLLAKTVHVGVYAALTFWALRLATTPAQTREKTRLTWWPWLLFSAHAFLTEWGQTMVKERSGSLLDVGWDHLGIVLGTVIKAAGVVLAQKAKPPETP